MTHHANALIFFGLYFSSLEEGDAFLTQHNVNYDSDSIDEDAHESLGFQPLEDGGYMLGFSLKPGESDAYARSLWEQRVDRDVGDAQSHLHVEYS